LKNGVIAGYPIVDVKATLVDGSYHEVDSSEIAFHLAAARAVRVGIPQADPVLLEPIMKVEVVVPEDYMGDVMGDLSSRRGRIIGIEAQGHLQEIRAEVPLAEMFGYATVLRSLTQGRGSFVMEFSHYEEVPSKIAETIIESRGKLRRSEE